MLCIEQICLQNRQKWGIMKDIYDFGRNHIDMKIAITFDQTETITDFANATVIRIYTKKDQQWIESDSIDLRTDRKISPSAIRCHLEQLIPAFGDCRVIVSANIAGIAYHVFEKNSF
jgi:hypothetical protein